MSDDDVEDMAIVNEFFPIVDDEENEL
jgi:hypothetical protein